MLHCTASLLLTSPAPTTTPPPPPPPPPLLPGWSDGLIQFRCRCLVYFPDGRTASFKTGVVVCDNLPAILGDEVPGEFPPLLKRSLDSARLDLRPRVAYHTGEWPMQVFLSAFPTSHEHHVMCTTGELLSCPFPQCCGTRFVVRCCSSHKTLRLKLLPGLRVCRHNKYRCGENLAQVVQVVQVWLCHARPENRTACVCVLPDPGDQGFHCRTFSQYCTLAVCGNVGVEGKKRVRSMRDKQQDPSNAKAHNYKSSWGTIVLSQDCHRWCTFASLGCESAVSGSQGPGPSPLRMHWSWPPV